MAPADWLVSSTALVTPGHMRHRILGAARRLPYAVRNLRGRGGLLLNRAGNLLRMLVDFAHRRDDRLHGLDMTRRGDSSCQTGPAMVKTS
jgi:hypothetical protein